ncbi:MAG: hypothetical protein ACXABY_28965 [Candidatus Thorarchaeota archaeon]|jgi:hypothetical protein
MDCNLQKAEQILKEDPNGKELTDKNWQVVLGLLTCEIVSIKAAFNLIKGL